MSTTEHHAGPLEQASPEAEHHPGPLPKADCAQRPKRRWREKRWERRRRRRMGEEVLGWIFVPVILLAGYWAMKASLAAFGTNFTALVQGIRVAISSAGKG